MPRTSARCRFLWRAAIALATVAVAAATVRAGPAPADSPDALFNAVREAVAAGRAGRTMLVGYDNGRATVRDDPPAGGVLVGFEVGLGEFVGKQVIYSLRPLYLTAAGVVPSQPFGLPQGQRGTGKHGPRSKVTRTVTVQGRAGYAVGDIAVDSGLLIDALQITFVRIRGTALDPSESYAEGWVGTHQDKKPKVLSSNGDPIVGMVARQDDDHVMAIGLIRMLPVEPAPSPPAERPATRPADKAPQPPAAKDTAAAPPQKSDAPPTAQPAGKEGDFPWVPLAVFVLVSVPVAVILLIVTRPREPARRRTPEGGKAGAGSRRAAAADSGIRRSADVKRRRRRSDNPAEVLPVDEVEVLPEDEIAEVLPADDDAPSPLPDPPPNPSPDPGRDRAS